LFALRVDPARASARFVRNSELRTGGWFAVC
jgi:hypothetical protein